MTNNSANSQEFQVVILAGGKGNRMYPLTEDIPKCLLPVANRPLISYQLELLERVGFSDAIVVTNAEIASDVKKYISEIHKGKIEVKFEVTKPNLGTAETLVKIKDKIKTDFIVISGDLIVTENFLFHLVHMHRTRDAALTMLLSKPPVKSPEEILRIKKEGLETEGSSDYIGITDQGRVTFFSNAADLEENLVLSKSQLRTYPNFTMYTDLLDAHFYIFAKWTLDVLEKYEKQIASIKGEFIPFLVKLQFRKKLKKGGLPETVNDTQSLAMSMSSSSRNVERDNLGCFAYIMDQGFAARVNTIPSYLEANREISKGTVGYVPWERPGKGNFIHEGALVDPKTQVGPECVVGEGTKVGERVAIKKSTIGKHCTIGKNVKIANSVIMDYVTLLDGTSVQNSIICHNAHVGANSNLTSCQVGPGYNLEAGSKVKSESLIADDSGISEEIAL